MNDASPFRHDEFRADRAGDRLIGVREVRLRLPDTRSAAFAAEARVQAALLDQGADEREAGAMMDRLAAEAPRDWT